MKGLTRWFVAPVCKGSIPLYRPIMIISETEISFAFSLHKKVRKKSKKGLVLGQDWFLPSNNALKELYLPKLKIIYDYFLEQNNVLLKFNAPELNEIGDNFLYYNETLNEFYAPKLDRIGGNYSAYNNFLKEPEFKPKTIKLKNSNTN